MNCVNNDVFGILIKLSTEIVDTMAYYIDAFPTKHRKQQFKIITIKGKIFSHFVRQLLLIFSIYWLRCFVRNVIDMLVFKLCT